MGPRLLCFVGGAALSAFFVLLGLLATPFFGSGAFLWANVFGCFLLASALGHGLGDLIVSFGRVSGKSVAPALAAFGGVLAWVAAYLLPEVCRWVLAHDAEWDLAPAASLAIAALLPGTMMAAIVPCELKARLDECENPHAAARIALRLMGLMTVGAIGGMLITAKPVLKADEVDVWVYAYGTGAVLTAFGLALLPNLARGIGGLTLVGLAILSGALPSEIQYQQFAVALETAWEAGHGASVYYKRTNGEKLDDAALERLRKDANLAKPGVIVTLELLERLSDSRYGADGEGLLRTVDLLLPTGTKPYILPFFRQIESVQCDGGRMLRVAIKRRRGEDGTAFHIPGANPGEKVKFVFADDFTMRIIHVENVWKLEFGPLSVVSAGVFEFNDTKSTPVRVKNVALWVDASVLGLIFEDHPDQVVIKAIAQGEIGDVKTVEVLVIPKEQKK